MASTAVYVSLSSKDKDHALLRPYAGKLVGPIRFELMTSRLSSVRSNQLSYGPIGRIDQDPVRSLLRDQNPFLGSRSPRLPKRLTRSGKRNEDGGDPLTVYNRSFNRIVARQEPGETSLERR